MTASRLGLGSLRVAAQFGLAEDRKAQCAHGGKVAVRARPAHLADAVVAAKAQAGQPLAAIGRVDGLHLDRLILQGLVVLAVLEGNSADLLGCLGSQFAVGSRVGEGNRLAGVDADLALEQDEVLFIGVLRGDQRLLLGLELHARPQLIQIRRDAGHVSFVGVFEQHSVRRLQRPGVVHLAGCGNGVQISRSHLLHHLAARRHLNEVGCALRRGYRLPSGNHRPREEHLAELNFALGQVVAGNLGESRRQLAARKQRQKHLECAGSKAHRGQILLVDAEVAGEHDRWQKVLQGLVLLPLEELLAVFGFPEAQIVLESKSNRVVQGEFEGLAGSRPQGHAAEERIRGGAGVRRLRIKRARQSQARKPNRPRPPDVRLSRSIH